MAVPAILTNVVDSAIAQFRSALSNSQSSYFSANNRYWQGLATHNAPPNANSPTSPTRLGRAPTDQPVTWNDLESQHAPSTLPIPSRALVKVHSYLNPTEGHGYLIVAEAQAQGKTWRRQIDEGTAARSLNWHEVI